ncbi:hypothetical protein LOD99_13337 [Oopsacas minuta]|uniref:Uncharacterized protein n=1 Tax=Oopsacas minuta TaxID=111878 RepID=A0AAV7KMU1_9METZ|nr:hypothetical protein LOD99_13337 [Oopsacas minuta]
MSISTFYLSLEQNMAKSKYNNILESNTLSNVSKLMNLNTFANTWTQDAHMQDTITGNSTCLKRYLADAEDENDSARNRMIIEQLKMIKKSKHSRRNSPDLIISSFIVYSTSAAAYQCL